MGYQLEGQLRGGLCDDCTDQLAGVLVRLYRPPSVAAAPPQTAANPKTTFRVLSEDQVRARANDLIAETTTDAEGGFRFDLDPRTYRGEAFEMIVEVRSVTGQKTDLRQTVAFTLTTLQPQWAPKGNDFIAPFWQYTVSSRFWCWVRQLFGAWVICGTVCNRQQQPLDGLIVNAFDRDWLQDDLLGAAPTDENGRFRIDYTPAQFTPTVFPWLNVELTSGPDVYFEVTTGAGDVLLNESPSTGRIAGRENVGACFCVKLVVDADPTPPYNDPLFTHVGNFHILSDIGAGGTTNFGVLGAGGVGYGFFNCLNLKGFCPKTHPTTGLPMFYRFLYVDPETSIERPLTGDNLVCPVQVGSKLVWWDVDSDGTFGWTFQSIHLAGSGATPPLPPGGSGPLPIHVIVPDADGWVAVDPDGLDDGFYGPLLAANSNGIVPGGLPPNNGAGNPVADPRNGQLVTFIFETTTNPANPALTERQTDMVTLLINNWEEVRLLELIHPVSGGAVGCDDITDSVTVHYTVDHELLVLEPDLGISGASGDGWNAPAGTFAGRGGAGSISVNTAGWDACSYSATLTTQRKLTNGESNDDEDTSPVTFCKS